MVFFDDILVSGSSWPLYLHQLEVVSKILLQRLSKCYFSFQQIDHLGHAISGQGVAIDEETERFPWPLLANLKQLRGFLGLTGYYKRFIKGYTAMAVPLTNLLNKEIFFWNGPTAIERHISPFLFNFDGRLFPINK